MSQASQEYPEMAELFARLHQLVVRQPGERVQMLARVGFAEPVGPAPRHALSTHVVE
jgi:hypothetical protein